MKIAVMGYGTIGSGVVEVLNINKDKIAQRAGEPVEVKYILDLRDFPGDPMEDKVVKDYQIIANDPEVGVVVETMGGVEPAYTFVKAMLEAGKSVTTSNKALVADKGAELLRVAREHGCNFVFEAAVGGGIPIIRTLNACLTADIIEEIAGIVNGTTNYMLTKMDTEGCDYDAVLKEAQEKGYAEKDPTADVEGFDACRKIAILTSLVAGKQVDFEDIPTEGISNITATDFKYAAALSRNIKLVARSMRVGDTYTCRVAPFLLSKDAMLSNVSGVMNAVFVKGNMLGESMYYGAGAGSLPTASAVVADMVFLARNAHHNVPMKWDAEKLELAESALQQFRYLVRTNADDEAIKANFGDVEFVDIDLEEEIGFVTDKMTEAEFDAKINEMGDVISFLRFA